MDPKLQSPQLDPKLKEAYDKVMNANIPTTPEPPTESATQPTTNPIPPTDPATQNPVQPVPQPIQPTIVASSSPSVPRRDAEKIHIGGTPGSVKKKSGVSPVIYILGGLLFLVVYIIFWLKFFNVPVPFLPF